MNIELDMSRAYLYHSSAQKARVVTESWVTENMFCPRCGNTYIEHFPNNKPVADFFCPKCQCEYELKSKNGKLLHKINDGAYDTMIARINSRQNPDFFFMNYSLERRCVVDFLLIPKHFFVPAIIEKRKALSVTAKRAGWVGCNILINEIPKQGQIHIITNGECETPSEIVKKVHESDKLRIQNINARGWLMEVLKCVNQIDAHEFTLNEIYAFEDVLSQKYPLNKNIKPKIRQQLQLLRDKEIISFLGNGVYRKL